MGGCVENRVFEEVASAGGPLFCRWSYPRLLFVATGVVLEEVKAVRSGTPICGSFTPVANIMPRLAVRLFHLFLLRSLVHVRVKRSGQCALCALPSFRLA